MAKLKNAQKQPGNIQLKRCKSASERQIFPVTLSKGKKGIGKQPFATEQQIHQIDPVWIMGPVPCGFWKNESNHRDYFLWLAWKLGFRTMQDWYRFKTSDIEKNHGTGMLIYWERSLTKAIQGCFPEYDWHEWRFSSVPQRFWEDPVNRRRYFKWLGLQLGYRRATDWLMIREDDIAAYCGNALVNRFSSMHTLLKEYLPELDWDQFLAPPSLSVAQILELADAYRLEHGKWPSVHSGPIPGVNLTWNGINERLRQGYTGLRAGSSLMRLISQHRKTRARA
jgi:hypothetical protein